MRALLRLIRRVALLATLVTFVTFAIKTPTIALYHELAIDKLASVVSAFSGEEAGLLYKSKVAQELLAADADNQLWLIAETLVHRDALVGHVEARRYAVALDAQRMLELVRPVQAGATTLNINGSELSGKALEEHILAEFEKHQQKQAELATWEKALELYDAALASAESVREGTLADVWALRAADERMRAEEMLTRIAGGGTLGAELSEVLRQVLDRRESIRAEWERIQGEVEAIVQ